MKVLYFHSSFQDYLADSLFHGLRSLIGTDCVDVPRYDIMYKPLSHQLKNTLRGNGFSLYGLLEEDPELIEKRAHWLKDIEQYEVVVISHIWHLWPLLIKYKNIFKKKKIAVLDGADIPAIFPYNSMVDRIKNHPISFFISLKNIIYFKRELFDSFHSYALDRLIPSKLAFNWNMPKNILPISFSIPEEKISKITIDQKSKVFVNHIVDEEVSKRFEGSFYSETGSDKLIFKQESEYYGDIQKSKYGITTKRAGWDCLRHYELAANGAVLCFRELTDKPPLSAPHDLNLKNAIIYKNADDLFKKIESVSLNEYNHLLSETYEWVVSKSTKNIARIFLDQCVNSSHL